MKKKAEEIRRRSSEERRKTKNEQKKRGSFISIPNSQHTETIASYLRRAGSNIAITSGKKIDSLIRTKNKNSETKSVSYKIPCLVHAWRHIYIGETGRGMSVRLKEHKRDVGNHDTKNARVPYIETCGSLPDWERAEVIKKDMHKSVSNLSGKLWKRHTFF